MDIYEDVMKLEIKTQPLVQAIILSDDDDDGEETEKNAEKQNMDKDKANKNNTALPTAKAVEKENKIPNGTESKIVASAAAVTKNGTTATQNFVDDAKASTSAENSAEEGQNSDDDTAMIIDDDVAESTARTRVYVRKRKLGSDNASDTTVAPGKEMSTSSRKVWTSGRGTTENSHSNVETGANVPKEQEQPQAKSTDVPQESNTNNQSKPQPTDGKPPIDTSKSQPVQKPKRRLIAVSAASIAAGVLTGLGVSADKDTSQKTG